MFFPRLLPLPATLGAAVVFSLAALGSVHAAKVPAPGAGEIYVGFRADETSVSYLVKLGLDTTFRNAAQGTSFEVTGLGNVGADLTTTFGAGWANRADLQWGIFGGRQTLNSTLYASAPRTVPGAVATPWPALVQQARNTVITSIVDVTAGLGGYGDGEATANSPVGTLQPNSDADSSYFAQVATAGTTDFDSLSSWTSIEGNFSNGVSGAVLDLFRIGGTGVSHVGSFSIGATGTITFTAVPLVSDGDADGDGFTDAQEALAGTDPASASSFPQALVSVAATGLRVQQSVTAANRVYTVEYSETLSAGPWITVGTHNSGAAAAPLDFIDTDAGRLAKGRGFYRVRVSS